MKLNYKKIRENVLREYQKYLRKVKLISMYRFLNFILIIVFLCLLSRGSVYLVLSVLFIIFFIVLILLHDNYYKKVDYYEIYLRILKDYELRIENRWDSLPNSGIEYLNDGNIYLNDLNILGKHSLYQFLCSAKTRGGKDRLFHCLDNIELSQESLKARQEIIQELAGYKEFVLEFQVYLSKIEENINLEDNIKYLDEKIGNHFFLLLTIFGNGISMIVLLFGLFNIISVYVFFYLVIFKYLISYIYSFIYKEEFRNISCLARGVSKLDQVVNCIIAKDFKNKNLNVIKENMIRGKSVINELDSLNTFSKLKDNFIANLIFNGIFTVDPYILYKYCKLCKQGSLSLKNLINDIEDLEWYISLANVALVRDKVCMPKRTKKIKLEFSGLIHPLLDEDKCISNDYINDVNINIITGSNMSGKTSFLRTMGINLILANAGSYVCAENFTSSYLKIFTSMSVQDNIEKGISTFYGELLRIKEAIVYQDENKPMIVLVDEIFKGTNYNDRILGAVNVIKKLNKNNVILFITTHDFELCDTDVAKVSNYYFSEYYEQDNIKFDYKIRKGRCKTTNARYLMKRLNILDENSG